MFQGQLYLLLRSSSARIETWPWFVGLVGGSKDTAHGENMSFLLPIYVISWPAAFILLGIGAKTDLKDRIIPNELVVAVAAIGLAHTLLARPWLVWLSLLAAAVVFCGLGILSHHKIIGGGDTKLISAVTFLVAPDRVGQLLIEIALAGGLLSCFYLAAHYGLKSLSASQSTALEVVTPESVFSQMIKSERARIATGDSLPYAVAVLGGVSFYIAREFFQCFYAMSCSL
jgi:prepilin peptidase CpaA